VITNRDIIIFSGDWNIFPSTLQHIGQVLAAANRILWVAGLGHRKPKLQVYDFKRIIAKGTRMLTQRYVKNNSIPVIETHPFVLPYYDTAMIRRFNDRSLRNHLRKKMNELNFHNPIVIVSNPVAAGVIGQLGESSSHYFCVDDYSHFKDSFRSTRSLEQEILEKVDSCFAVSDALVQTRKPKNGKSYFVPQGVDTAHFHPRSTNLPEQIASIQKPVVGFFGLIAPWIDLELIVHCAHHYSNVSFVLIGRPSTDLTPLKQVSNIYYLGEVSYTKLPSYAQVFDVGIVPFLINELTLPSNPLKLLEYLAMGIPVVSTNLPEARKFSDFVYIAQDKNQFVDLVGVALNEQSDEKKRQRVEFVQQYSWHTIVENISEVILGIEEKKQGRDVLSTKLSHSLNVNLPTLIKNDTEKKSHTPRRILFIGMKYDYGNVQRGLSFEEINFLGTLNNMQDIIVSSFPYDIIMREKGRKEMNEYLKKFVLDWKPDVCFFFLHTDEIQEETIRWITEKSGSQTINWFADDHWRFQNFSRHWAPLFHWSVTTDSQAVEKYYRIGYKNVIKSQWAFNHHLYKPYPVPLEYDVTFVGQVHSDRKAIVNKVQRAGVDIRCWGSGWENGRLSQEEMIKLFSRSRINLNFTQGSFVFNWKTLAKVFFKRRVDNTLSLNTPREMLESTAVLFSSPSSQIKGRNFEIPGSGGFLLTSEADNLREYFEPGKEIVIFTDADDLIDKIRYYLSHETERENIRSAGYQRSLRDHTFEKRFLDIFQTMGVIDSTNKTRGLAQ